jgi:hypothetical protein
MVVGELFVKLMVIIKEGMIVITSVFKEGF